MSPEFSAAAAFAIAAVVTFLVTPVAIRVAVADASSSTSRPATRATRRRRLIWAARRSSSASWPRCCSCAVAASTHWVIIVGAIAIWAIGTIDDRVNLPISFRTLVEAGIAVLLWSTGRGWDVFHDAPADLALTVVWVVGVMNAFNLMDNMDGAAASVAAVSALGAGDARR